MLYRAFRYELSPTAAQAATLLEWVGVTRLVYNLCLEQRRDFYRQYRRATGKTLGWGFQSKEVTDLRAAFGWIAAVPRQALERAVIDLDSAFTAFFTGRAGYPTPRRRGDNDAFRLQAKHCWIRKLNAKWSVVRLPVIGLVRFRDTRPVSGRPLTACVRLRDGRWTIVFTCEVAAVSGETREAVTGIDRGVARTLTFSTGEYIQAPDTRAITLRHKRGQKALARCKRGSARRVVAKARVAALSARAARIRTDWCHRTSTDIARRFGLVAIEDLNIKNMTARAAGTVAEPGRNVRQKAGLNRSILEQCWGKFASQLDYKLTERGGVLISVPAAYTSQTCAECGVVDARSRESQAVFRCIACGHTDNADTNAAREILRRSTAWPGVEGSHSEPAEAPIRAAVAA